MGRASVMVVLVAPLPKFMIEKCGYEEFRVEKSGVEMSRVEIFGVGVLVLKILVLKCPATCDSTEASLTISVEIT